MSATQDVEELDVTFQDIDGFLSQPVLQDRIEEIINQETLSYRQAFRDFDATNINSNTVEIPINDDAMGNPKIVAEGSEFHRDQETYTKKTLTFDKFGFEVAVTMEAQEDSQVDLVRDQVERQARQMREEMNLQAFNVLTSNVQTTVVNGSGGTAGTMEYGDILAGREELLNDAFQPDLMIADVAAVHDLLDSNNFLEASDLQGELRRSGEVGQIAGMSIIEDNSGLNITGNSDPGAVVVDTGFYGYEGTRMPVTTQEYEETRTQTDVFRVFNRMGWLVTQPQAAVIVQG